MAASDSRPIPRKNTAFRHYFAIRRNDGTLVTGWTGADSEVSGDGGAFADCTSEATEIGSSGCGYIDLTAGEMNYDAVMLKVIVTNNRALPFVVTMFPEESGDFRVDATAVADGVLSRNVSNVEDAAPEHCLGNVVLAIFEYAVAGTTWTIKQTDGSTTQLTKTVVFDEATGHVTGVS